VTQIGHYLRTLTTMCLCLVRVFVHVRVRCHRLTVTSAPETICYQYDTDTISHYSKSSNWPLRLRIYLENTITIEDKVIKVITKLLTNDRIIESSLRHHRLPQIGQYLK